MRRLARFSLAAAVTITVAVAVNASPLGAAVWDLLRVLGIVSYPDCTDNWVLYLGAVANTITACASPISRLVVSLATTVLASLGAGTLTYFLTGRIQQRQS